MLRPARRSLGSFADEHPYEPEDDGKAEQPAEPGPQTGGEGLRQGRRGTGDADDDDDGHTHQGREGP